MPFRKVSFRYSGSVRTVMSKAVTQSFVGCAVTEGYRACRLIALDHRCGDVYLMTLVHPEDAVSTSSAKAWRRCQEARIMQILQQSQPGDPLAQTQKESSSNGHADCNTATQPPRCPNGYSAKAVTDTVLEERQHSNGHAEVWYLVAKLACLLYFAAVMCFGWLVHASEREPGTAMQTCERVERQPEIEPFRLHRTRDTYMADVQACKDALYAGESYELCLTTALSRRGAPRKALDLYTILRRLSPAPYAAFLSFGDEGPRVRLAPRYQEPSDVYRGPLQCSRTAETTS